MEEVVASLAHEMQEHLRASRWGAVIQTYERELSRTERSSAEYRLPYAVALIRSGRTKVGLKLLDSECLRQPDAQALVHRYVTRHLLQNGENQSALDLLSRVLDMFPGSLEELRARSILLFRLKRQDEALADIEAVLARAPDDIPGHVSYLQGLLQSGRNDEASAHALTLGDRLLDHSRLTALGLVALNRGEEWDRAVEIAAAVDETSIEDPTLPAQIVRTYFEAGKIDDAIAAGDRLMASGWDDAALRGVLGQAHMATTSEDRYENAIDHLRAALALRDDDGRAHTLLGEALLRTRAYDEAVTHLEQACKLQPKVAQTRALYARALKQCGRYGDAAREFKQLLSMQPSSPRWQRYAAGALSQAGERQEAARLFNRFVAERAASLPKSFESGLEALWEGLDDLKIPQARLDWAWTLQSAPAEDREEWERSAKWGHLADHYLLDWLECRSDRVHEAMLRLADLGDAERALAPIDKSKGMILASAHIGPMYAGPLALELLGLRSRWLASTPSVARTAYTRSLISTSDQDDMHVAKAFMQSVRQGYAVVIAVDGAINLGAPRIAFEGQEITYSSFAARTAHRLGVPSVFCAPFWQGDRIGFVIEPLPDPEPDESVDAYSDRWRDAFLEKVRTFLSGDPRNLRLSGGLWRHIR